MAKSGLFGQKYCSKSTYFYVWFGPGTVPLQTRVRVLDLDPGTRVSDPGLDALSPAKFQSSIKMIPFNLSTFVRTIYKYFLK